jgi:hypothetical protein
MLQGLLGTKDTLNLFDSNEQLHYRARQAVQVTCCSISSAIVRAAEIELEKMDWPTQQSFSYKGNLRLHEGECLFSCIQFRSFFAHGFAPVPGGIVGGKGQMVPLLANVPHVQEIAVAGGGNFSSSFPCCAIQCGTHFFF